MRTSWVEDATEGRTFSSIVYIFMDTGARSWALFCEVVTSPHIQPQAFTNPGLQIQAHVGHRRRSQHSNGILHVPHSWDGLDGVRQYLMNANCANIALARALSPDSMADSLPWTQRASGPCRACLSRLPNKYHLLPTCTCLHTA